MEGSEESMHEGEKESGPEHVRTGVAELAVAGGVGEVEGARPPVAEALAVRPRAHLRELAVGPRRQERLHPRQRLARQETLHGNDTSDQPSLPRRPSAGTGEVRRSVGGSRTSAILQVM